MTQLRTRFKVKLVVAVTSLLGWLIVLASLFYVSAQQYQYHLERKKLAYGVLSSYQSVSDHTYRKLNAMGEIVAHGTIDDVQARSDNEQLLRNALRGVRQGIASEVAFVRDENEAEELEHLIAIERLTERIIRGSAVIRKAVQQGDRAGAQRELSVLRSKVVAGAFSDLIDEAIEEEREEVAETQVRAEALGRYIETVLPLAIGLVVVVGLLLTTLVARSLSRSIAALDGAAKAYASGDLDHRIDALPEQEFSQLGQAFNRMAMELSTRREAAQQSQESLEALVQARTQELEASNERLETADRSRRQLLTDISHELRTPLTVIQGESEMALRGKTKEIPEYQEAIERIREQAVHTTRLVEDLLFVARAEEGKARIEKRPVAVAGVLRGVCADFRAVAEKKRIEIKETHTAEHLVVFGDAGRLRQVFTILLDNAVRYSHVEGAVFVAISSDGQIAEVTVTDQGIGLTEEEARRAFSRFYRGDNAERHAAGTGLGLPVAKAIVEAHEGRIGLSGKPGEGAKATVHLPIESKLRAIA